MIERVSPHFRLYIVGLLLATSPAAAPGQVSLVTDAQPGPATLHGLEEIEAALARREIPARRVGAVEEATGASLIVAGVATARGPAAQLLEKEQIALPEGPEALVTRRAEVGGKPAAIAWGSDDRGLMYALLDVADRIARAADRKHPLSEIRDVAEKPAVSDRAISKYTMHPRHFESTFHDPEYWERYLDLLARSRFNTFVLIFGYENWGYFSPPYPYLFDVEEFPDVRVVGLSKEEQARNLASLNRLIEMVHARGLNFTLGIWDHIYRGGVQGPTELAKRPTEGRVWGVTTDNLVSFTQAALPQLLRRVPGIDAIQFRMHGESGLRRGEMGTFWETVYRIMKEQAPDVRFDARAKNFPDSLIDRALETGVDLRICTKYWMEQMGMPFHPTHIHPRNQHDRRHGYADLLRYPKRYPVHWRLWSGGTQRILLWGDPEYVRRFSRSTHLYDGQGFEVNEPLATKMQDQPFELEPFDLLRPPYRHYDWEFERYWHFFQLWGRLGYNPETPADVWRCEFVSRFGEERGPLIEKALHAASRILPRIVAYSYPYRYFPTTRGWAEKQRMGDLPVYAKALPSDTEQFLSINEAARIALEGGSSAKMHPEESSRWFARAAEEVLALVSAVEELSHEKPSPELVVTLADLKILAGLARYHASRAMAGLQYALYSQSGDVAALDRALVREEEAISAWRGIVAAAGDIYHDDLMFGRRSAGLSGHWKDELALLEEGLERLKEERKAFRPPEASGGPHIAHAPIRRSRPGRALEIRATVGGVTDSEARVVLRRTHGDAEPKVLAMSSVAPSVWGATIPAGDVKSGLGYSMEARDAHGNVARFPEHDALVTITVTSDEEPPSLVHRAVRSARPSKPLRITAEVRDPSGVAWVRLAYRNVTQYEDYNKLPLHHVEGDRFEVLVPAEALDSRWDFMYFFETMDVHGNGKIYPDMEREAPYIVVPLDR